ncbi:glycerophosphodiester phosphodiesterase [Paenibacillus barcinonensis]|uniref:Glycerophosphodiester phosphodiesterase n=1 Tax=Paenibacillus barcinonensis TaxID=198119 RepID=A0A2V4W154_PAEBA|nr:glycerophosphodiester phosphodiesterase [Paenibacillus barcinonensis]PYE48088.1 glycerophosphoryl diester phosphodiesterase [Paenibacillus barcinonensis]QKS55196.1 glycerophosphodiester phosphodiesterase [Paenibacillus barcinonensis]
MSDFPLITAHTGCMGHPDHSFESLQAALSLGVDIYEDDIRVTRDGIPVLAHDDEVILTGGVQSSLESLTWHELAEESSVVFPTLEHTLSHIREANTVMNLDIKTALVLEPVSALIEQLHMQEQVFLSGCSYKTALKAAKSAPHIRRLLNVNLEHFERLSYTEAIIQMCREAEFAGCFGLNLPYQAVQEQCIDIAVSNGLSVYVWTVSEADDMRRLARWGVHSITTRNPLLLTTIRDEMNEIKRAEENGFESKAEL